MKKKLLVLVAMLLCVVTVLASCASSMKFEKIVGDGTYNDENPTLTTAAKVDVKGEVDYVKGDLVVFEDWNAETDVSTYNVYNLATGTVVYTAADSEKTEGNVTTVVEHDIEIITQWETTWFVVYIETLTTTTTEVNGVTETDETESLTVSLRDAKGNEFATATDIYDNEVEDDMLVLDLIIFNEKAYRIADDGTIAHAFDFSALRTVPVVTNKVGNYYYSEMRTNGILAGVEVYNSNLELVAYYEKPSYISSNARSVIAPLNNGNVLIQYAVLENDMAEDYTYIAGGDKYTLYTFLLDVEKGKTKEMSLDYVIADVTPRDDGEYWKLLGMNQEIENIATVYPIEDERVDMSFMSRKVAVMTNKGKIDGMIDGIIDNMMPGGILQVANNRWIVMNLSYQMFVVNENGEVIGEVTGAVGTFQDLMKSVSTGFKPYFIQNGKIYDWDLTVKYDMTANKIKSNYIELAHGVLMENEDGETLLYANGEVKTLVAKDAADNKAVAALPIGVDDQLKPIYSTDGFVIVTETEGKEKWEFYNDLGAIVLTLENAELDEDFYIGAADSNNAFMIAVEETVTVDGVETQKTVYYRFG